MSEIAALLRQLERHGIHIPRYCLVPRCQSFECVVEIEPQPKGRPRMSRNGHTYTPPKTKKYEAALALALQSQWSGPPKDCAMVVDAVFVVSRINRLRGEKYSHGLIEKATKPDVDNYLKALFEAIEKAGIVVNDSRLTAGSHAKYYAERNGSPRIELRLSWNE